MLQLQGLVVTVKLARTASKAMPPDCIINLRADLAGDIDPARLRHKGAKQLLYSLRSQGQNGNSSDCDTVRHHRLLAAAQQFEFIELEAERDLVPHLLSAIEPQRRVVSWHGDEADAASLTWRFSTMVGIPAALYLLVPRARRLAESTTPLRFLSTLGRCDVLAYDQGAAGFWTRLIAPRLGAPLVFAEGDGQSPDPDVSSVSALLGDYGLPELSPVRTLYGIMGREVLRSGSPRLHNAKFRANGRAALFLPFTILDFNEFRDSIKAIEELGQWGLSLRGLTVTAPFKEAALAFANSRSIPAVRAGAANLLVRRNDEWHADTTDPQGVMGALAARRLSVYGVAAVVIGCGGAGRAVAAALADAGARVTLANRSTRNGRAAGQHLGLPFVPLSRLHPANYRLVVNATPVGTDGEGTPTDPKALDAAAIVIDLVYRCGVTPLVAGARARDMTVVDGFEVLTHQVGHQYARMANVDDSDHDVISFQRPPHLRRLTELRV
jgi:3-dehydroquinate dehydratase/shikimate dehydrogenase